MCYILPTFPATALKSHRLDFLCFPKPCSSPCFIEFELLFFIPCHRVNFYQHIFDSVNYIIFINESRQVNCLENTARIWKDYCFRVADIASTYITSRYDETCLLHGVGKLVRQAERRRKLVRQAVRWGNLFFDGVGNTSGVGGGKKNVEGE